YWPSRAAHGWAGQGAAPARAGLRRGDGDRGVVPALVQARAGSARAGSAWAGRDALVTQAIMGAATAGMLVPRLDPVPLAAWQILAAAGTAWFTWRCLRAAMTSLPGGEHRDGHHLPHALACGAMLYMLLAGSPAGPGLMHGPAPLPVLAIGFALAMAWAAVVTTDRLAVLTPARTAPAGTAERIALPRLAACCQAAMGIAMAYLLVQML
ncbi:MAG TPA: hypothetical protein DHU96_33250, partial [Actinobacteria bacterium]|nr:hypothetical protein [Actinomycetota bacterium]